MNRGFVLHVSPLYDILFASRSLKSGQLYYVRIGDGRHIQHAINNVIRIL